MLGLRENVPFLKLARHNVIKMLPNRLFDNILIVILFEIVCFIFVVYGKLSNVTLFRYFVFMDVNNITW